MFTTVICWEERDRRPCVTGVYTVFPSLGRSGDYRRGVL